MENSPRRVQLCEGKAVQESRNKKGIMNMPKIAMALLGGATIANTQSLSNKHGCALHIQITYGAPRV